MSHKNIIISAISFLLIGMIGLNIHIHKKINDVTHAESKPVEVKAEPKAKEVKTSTKKTVRHKLVPENPEKYGMVVFTELDQPTTQDHWEKSLRNTFEKNKVFEGERAQKALEVAETNTEDFNEQMAKLDKQIDMWEEKVKNEPDNTVFEDQLQRFYRLKAVGNILGEKVVKENPNSPFKNMPKVVSPSQP